MRTAFLLFMALCSTSFAAAQKLELSGTDFGAGMDGATDDTAAFQKALDALPDRGVLNIPAGTAILSDALVLANKTAAIRGAGSGVTRLSWKEPGGLHLIETRTWRESRAQKASWDVRDIAFTTHLAAGGTALFADFKNNSATFDDHGIVLEEKVRQPVCSGNVFHLRSDREIINRSAASLEEGDRASVAERRDDGSRGFRTHGETEHPYKTPMLPSCMESGRQTLWIL